VPANTGDALPFFAIAATAWHNPQEQKGTML
jgi:hypothetical protein